MRSFSAQRSDGRWLSGRWQLGLISREEIRRRAHDTLALLEASHLSKRAPQTLSAGEKKHVALASLLMMSPSVLLLDEPTAGLDPRSQSTLLEILSGLHDAGVTLVSATQDLGLLAHLADRALVLGDRHAPSENSLEQRADSREPGTSAPHTLLRPQSEAARPKPAPLGSLAADGPVETILADIRLLRKANLIHTHTHTHGPLSHSHAHQHGTTHEHTHSSGSS